MKLKLTRPLCFFDLETTGTAISKDRIVEMAVLKLHPDGTTGKKEWRVNPGQPIPEEASNIHGITDDMVANEPTFKVLSREIYDFIVKSFLNDISINKKKSDYSNILQDIERKLTELEVARAKKEVNKIIERDL